MFYYEQPGCHFPLLISKRVLQFPPASEKVNPHRDSQISQYYTSVLTSSARSAKYHKSDIQKQRLSVKESLLECNNQWVSLTWPRGEKKRKEKEIIKRVIKGIKRANLQSKTSWHSKLARWGQFGFLFVCLLISGWGERDEGWAAPYCALSWLWDLCSGTQSQVCGKTNI